MADLALFLGDFEFQEEEIPERIAIGGEQRLVTRELVGGLKQVHAMGASSDPIQWTGWLRGPDALERGRYLDTLRSQGNQLTLVWSEFVYTVVIHRFTADFERYYQLPYTIVLEVVDDLSQPVRSLSSPSIDSLISGDMLSAGGLVEKLGMPSITSLYGDVQSAIGAVSSFANAAQSTLNSVLQPIAALRNEALTLAATVNNTLVNVTTVGGILPNNPIAQQVQKISSQIVATQQLPMLIALDRTMGRVQGNIGSIYNSAKRQTVAGANLMDMASKIYGDAMAWTGIAKANGVTDPQISGAAELTIPPTADQSGGVLNS